MNSPLLLNSASNYQELVFFAPERMRYCVNRNPFVSWADRPRYTYFVRKNDALELAKELFIRLEELRCLSREELESLRQERSIVQGVVVTDRYMTLVQGQPTVDHVSESTEKTGAKTDTSES